MYAKDLQDFFRNEHFALIKEPESQILKGIVLRDEQPATATSFDQPGFYFAPFDLSKHPVYFFHAKKSIFTFFNLEDFEINPENKNIIHFTKPDKDAHILKVKKALHYIQNNALKKIVISSRLNGEIEYFDAFCTFLNLSKLYPKSYIFYVQIKPGLSMMGATPEVLVKMEKSFGTIYSLAGTQEATEQIHWQRKELEEQDMVTGYIKDTLLKHQLPFSVEGPYTHIQGHMAHLRSDIQFISPPGKTKISDLIKELHPTPAVAGIPKDKAMQIIPGIEQYDREYYTGFLGENTGERIRFYVNLRSMKIENNQIHLYAGGGITADSIPEKEWEEVLNKWMILKKVLEE